MRNVVTRLRGKFSKERPWQKRFWQQDYKGCSLPFWFYSHQSQVACNLFLGAIFVTFGVVHVAIQRSIFELAVAYDHSTQRHDFTLNSDWPGPVFVYYELDNFHAPYRTFVESKDHFIVGSGFSKYNCKGAESRAHALRIRPGDEMFATLTEGKAMSGIQNKTAEGVLKRLADSDPSMLANSMIRPCGFAAFSVFLDRFELYRTANASESNAKEERLLLDETDLALDGDRELFRKKISYRSDGTPMVENNPMFLWGETQAEQAAILEHFMVWYRGASSSRFRNLWARIPAGLTKGTYSLMFRNHSDIWTKWRVNKKVVLTTMSTFGANNEFVGVAFILTGVSMLSVGFAFAILGWGQTEDAATLRPETKTALQQIVKQKHQEYAAYAGGRRSKELTSVVYQCSDADPGPPQSPCAAWEH